MRLKISVGRERLRRIFKPRLFNAKMATLTSVDPVRLLDPALTNPGFKVNSYPLAVTFLNQQLPQLLLILHVRAIIVFPELAEK